MASFWQTWPMVRPAARSTSAARSLGMIWSGVCFVMVVSSASWAFRDSHTTWTTFRGADHDEALDFVRRSKDKPFFLYLAFTIPHAKLQVPDLGPYDKETWPENLKKLAAMITRMDR